MDLAAQLQELAESPQVRRGGTCRVMYIYSELEDSDQMAFIQAVENKEINAGRLSKLMKDNGWDISLESIRRHRRRKTDIGGCKCP